ncbi:MULTISPECIES: hypothetical protein [unclassified Coleofasciculus]|uniref:hypothetical protein n=1 Tax=unclassified Coleofasciculus TaxID=2692782 RepID=UPI00187FA0E8|nr:MULTISPECIES: hypothetical protein [unclassified Coleofasciculus]MBE9127309.1 hypothetical protein [Coleofasciculus sp. LEGE 07081]MBE9150802.1 hypothetical protein [Coleofasciculus sp. LEGE 07092]
MPTLFSYEISNVLRGTPQSFSLYPSADSDVKGAICLWRQRFAIALCNCANESLVTACLRSVMSTAGFSI